MADLWNNDEPIRALGFDVPAWIDRDITPGDVAAIMQGGCESGAYMPAVTYHQALATMTEHGDNILDYLEETMDELPVPSAPTSWSGFACFYLSCAVEMWAFAIEPELENVLDETAGDEQAAL